MKHAYIAPIPLLDYVPQNSDFHLLLAHLLDNKKYCDFYRDKSERGDFIIVDNGAFENGSPMSLEHIWAKLEKAAIIPNVIVAPDYPGDNWQKTAEAFSDALVWKEHNLPDSVALMGVPQSEIGDWRGWIMCYKSILYQQAASTNDFRLWWVGMSILGIPNAFQSLTGTKDISLNRTFATIHLQQNHLTVVNARHHFLGCGDPRELLLMKKLRLAYSNDSSTAIWHAYNGITFDNSARGLVNGKIAREVDFYAAQPDLHFESNVKKNIKWIQKILQNTSLD